jgi:molybdate transport system substrate-binding protein
MPTHRLRRLVVVAALPVAFAACSKTSTTSTTTTVAGVTTTSGAPITGTLNVFGASSLTSAFNNAKTTLTGANAGLDLTYNFAGSNTLVAQIEQGAPADVFASADQKNMTTLVTAGLVDTPVVFAKNKLEIAVAPGNPKNITSLADLAKPGITVVLEATGVPAGDYTRQVETQLGINITPKSLEPDVKTAITQVTTGEVDATVVYVTDVHAAGAAVTGVPIPDNEQPAIVYPIAVVKATKNTAAAQAFVNSAVSGVIQRALQAQGFIAP